MYGTDKSTWDVIQLTLSWWKGPWAAPESNSASEFQSLFIHCNQLLSRIIFHGQFWCLVCPLPPFTNFSCSSGTFSLKNSLWITIMSSRMSFETSTKYVLSLGKSQLDLKKSLSSLFFFFFCLSGVFSSVLLDKFSGIGPPQKKHNPMNGATVGKLQIFQSS